MPFIDVPIDAGRVGKSVSGLAVSQPGPMQLAVAQGEVVLHETGEVCELSQEQTQQFVSHATLWTRVFVGLIADGASVDVWVDAYVDDGYTTQAQVPKGYRVVHDLAWCSIAPAEKDLLNGDVFRRTVA